MEDKARRYFKTNPKYQIKNKYRRNKDKSWYYVHEEGVTDNSKEELARDSTIGSSNGKECMFYAIKEDKLEPVIKKNREDYGSKI